MNTAKKTAELMAEQYGHWVAEKLAYSRFMKTANAGNVAKADFWSEVMDILYTQCQRKAVQ